METMRYTYKDMPDKSKEGILEEARNGLATAAFWFQTTQGIPVEIFKEWLHEKCPTAADSLHFYMNFRNQHPELFT